MLKIATWVWIVGVVGGFCVQQRGAAAHLSEPWQDPAFCEPEDRLAYLVIRIGLIIW
jgi:hypothetical protein